MTPTDLPPGPQKKPKPQLMWAAIDEDGNFMKVAHWQENVRELVQQLGVPVVRVEVRVVARKRKRRKP